MTPYQEEERTKLRRQSSKQAIALAMQGRWSEVVEANKSLLESFPNDVDAYNRLGRAYIERGEFSMAREAYEKAVEFDPYNTIARKNLERLSHLREVMTGCDGGFHKVEPQNFIKEVGKAGVVSLYRLAPPQVLARTVAGSRVDLRIDGPGLVAENSRREYLGQVEPRHGQRLIKLVQGGNKYTAAVVSSTEQAVSIMIREEYQDPSQAGRLSFPPKGTESFRPYAGERMGYRILRRELEQEESLPVESGYTIIGGEEAELLPAEASSADDEIENEE